MSVLLITENLKDKISLTVDLAKVLDEDVIDYAITILRNLRDFKVVINYSKEIDCTVHICENDIEDTFEDFIQDDCEEVMSCQTLDDIVTFINKQDNIPSLKDDDIALIQNFIEGKNL